MLNRLLSNLQFQGQALSLRAERQTVLASNIANTDTPNYKARDFDFASALAKATGTAVPSSAGGTGPNAGDAGSAGGTTPAVLPTTSLAAGSSSSASPSASAASIGPNGQLGLAGSNSRHLGAGGKGAQMYSSTDASMQYRTPDQASMDGNTVELDRERANFADNAVHYEATLKFINGNVRTILSAIRGE